MVTVPFIIISEVLKKFNNILLYNNDTIRYKLSINQINNR